MAYESTVGFIDSSGHTQQASISLELYKEAEDKKMSVAQLINRKYPTQAGQGTAFEQIMASSGLILSEDRHFGVRPASLEDIFSGKAEINLSGVAIERPDGSERHTPAGRLLFPAAMLEIIESELRENMDGYNNTFMRMVAYTRSVNSQRYDQVKVDYTRPRNARGQQIAQLAEPVRMLTITTSDVSRSIPIYSIGLEISKQALQASTLDLIGMAIREHSAAERSARLEADFANVVSGDPDTGDPGLSSVTVAAHTLDDDCYDGGGVNGSYPLTQRAWVKFLRQGWSKRTIDWAVMDLDTYFHLEDRAGRPDYQTVTMNDERLASTPRVVIPGVPGVVNVFITEGSPFGASTIIGLDSSKALRRMLYVGADYAAVEEFVMRRSTAMRFDWAERIEMAGYVDAFKVMTYSPTKS